jgi:hypothetical protein
MVYLKFQAVLTHKTFLRLGLMDIRVQFTYQKNACDFL